MQPIGLRRTRSRGEGKMRRSTIDEIRYCLTSNMGVGAATGHEKGAKINGLLRYTHLSIVTRKFS